MKKETVLKLVAAIVVPGGFIMWGLYELGRMVGNGEKVKQDGDDSSETKSDG